MLSNGKEIVRDKGKRKMENFCSGSSGDRKSKFSDGVLQFLDIDAKVAEGESDSCSDGSFINDDDENVEDVSYNKAIVKKEIDTAMEVMSLEEEERLVLERYGPGSSLVTYVDDQPLNQNTEILSLEYTNPSSKDPIIWKVKCSVGRERHSAVCLMQKFVELQNLGKTLQIVSAFAVKHVKGFLYIEAYKQCDVYEACHGICGTFPSGMIPVPERELYLLFHLSARTCNISMGTWIRVKKGKYKGDLAQVVEVNESGKKATLKLIPRIDLQAVTAKLLGGVPAKKTAIPAQKLISSCELEEIRPLIKYRKDRHTNQVYEILDGMMIKDGYLLSPSEDDLLKFESFTNEDPDELEWLSELYGEQERRLMIKCDTLNGEGEDSSSITTEDEFKVHDMVLFRGKEFGCIIGIENDDSFKVLTESSEGQSVVDLNLSEIKKLSCEKKFTARDHHYKIISRNSRVNIIEGPLQGKQGVVKHVYRGTVFVYDVTGLENGGYFCCKADNCDKIDISGFSSRNKGDELVALGTDDLLSSSKFHLLNNKARKDSTDSRISQNCEFINISSKDKGLTNGDLPLSSKKDTKESSVSRKFYLGGKDVIFTVGQSLKIRMGPLKGYHCQIMALAHSEITVKLDSQQSTFAVKPEHLIGVHERNGKDSAKQYSGLRGIQRCTKGNVQVDRNTDAGGIAATSFGIDGWSKNWNKTKGIGAKMNPSLDKQFGSSSFIKKVDKHEKGVSWSKQASVNGRLEATKAFSRGRGSGGRGGGRNEFGRGRGGGRGEFGRGRGGGRGESGRGRGGGRVESGRGRGRESGRGRGHGRGESGRGRGRGRGESGRERGGRDGKGPIGTERGSGRGGKAQFNIGRGSIDMKNMGRGSGRGSMNQFNMGRGNGRGGRDQFNLGRGGRDQFNLGRGGMDEFNMGRGNGRGGRGHYDMGGAGKEQFDIGRGSGRGGPNQLNISRGGMKQFNMGRGNGRGAQSLGGSDQQPKTFQVSRGCGGRTGRGGSRGGRGQFGRGTSSYDQGTTSGWKGEDKQNHFSKFQKQMGNGSQAGGWKMAASETGNQMTRFSGTSNAGVKTNVAANGRKRAAEMMGDQTKNWRNKKTSTGWT